MRKLNMWVHVGENRYGPDDEIPRDVAKLITNPDVWDGEADEADEATTLEAPAGNASREKWAAYAEQEGVEVEDDMTRDDIKTAVDQAKE